MVRLKQVTLAAFMVAAALSSGSPAPAQAASGSANLSVTVSGPASASVGDTVQYGIQVFNHGPDAASGGLFTSSFSGPGRYNKHVVIPGGASCRTHGNSISCNLGTIPAGIGVVLGFALDMRGTGTIVQNFAVTADQDDVDLSDNSGTITTTVLPPTG